MVKDKEYIDEEGKREITGIPKKQKLHGRIRSPGTSILCVLSSLVISSGIL